MEHRLKRDKRNNKDAWASGFTAELSGKVLLGNPKATDSKASPSLRWATVAFSSSESSLLRIMVIAAAAASQSSLSELLGQPLESFSPASWLPGVAVSASSPLGVALHWRSRGSRFLKSCSTSSTTPTSCPAASAPFDVHLAPPPVSLRSSRPLPRQAMHTTPLPALSTSSTKVSSRRHGVSEETGAARNTCNKTGCRRSTP
mmetsp:Transcript_123290/g.356235  ORF Transcript_123290/g.356235 Transcript_123290/m.356235 type:complete len:202 (+) Transcript_123290:3392-3997(+)